MRSFAVLLVLPVLALSITAVAPAAVQTDYFAWLHGSAQYRGAHGDSEYDVEGNSREVEVAVHHLNRQAGRRVTVAVNGRKVGTMRVSSRGHAHRQWKTEHGQSVPRAGAGSSIRVRTAGGTLIVSGTLQREPD